MVTVACVYDHQVCGGQLQSFLLPQTSFNSPKIKQLESTALCFKFVFCVEI